MGWRVLAAVLLGGCAGCAGSGASSADGGIDAGLTVPNRTLRLDPAEAKVVPGQTVNFTVLECDVSSPDTCSPTQRPLTGWAVENVAGGSNALGTLTVHGSVATYRAPLSRPTPNPVTVSVQTADPGKVTTLTAKVTVAGHYHVDGQIDALAYMGLCALLWATADVHGTFSFDLELSVLIGDVWHGTVNGWTDTSTVTSDVTSLLPMTTVSIDGAPELFNYASSLTVQSVDGTNQRLVLGGQRTSAGCTAHYPGGGTTTSPAQTVGASMIFTFAPAGSGPWAVTATGDLPWMLTITAL